MAFTLEHFCCLRPYLYHLTAATNIGSLARTRGIYCVKRLCELSGQPFDTSQKRESRRTVVLDGQQVVIRDQDPLHEGNIAFEDGWTFERLIEELNSRVFFWPGTQDKPNRYGMNHFGRYAAESPAILRIRTDELFQHNADATIDFCRFNAGSPRYNKGRPSPRGDSTFVSVDQASFPPGKVVEVLVRDQVMLPPSAEIAACPAGPWRPL